MHRNDGGKRASSTTRLAFATVLLSGLLAALAAWGGSWIGSHGTLSVQREQAQETRRTEARAKRTAVYTSFFAAANAFVLPSFRAAERCTTRPCNLGDWERIVGNQSEALINAYDQVAFYGSYDGFIAAGRLVNSFPVLVLFKREVAQRTPGNLSAQLDASYQEFVRVMCQELNAEPRSNCAALQLPVPPTLVLTKSATEAREHLPGGAITIYE
jgi:hypothetical protein